MYCPTFPDSRPQGKVREAPSGAATLRVLGFTLVADGIHPAKDKVRAICSALAPKNKAEFQAFLGLLNIYYAFLPLKATVAGPLHRLLVKRDPWVWGQCQATAFQAVKDLLTSNEILAYFDEAPLVVLTCDTLLYGVGAVLGHKLPGGTKVPVTYFSQTLLAERNYVQIDKKGLAIVKGVKSVRLALHYRHRSQATSGSLHTRLPNTPSTVPQGPLVVNIPGSLSVFLAVSEGQSHGPH